MEAGRRGKRPGAAASQGVASAQRLVRALRSWFRRGGWLSEHGFLTDFLCIGMLPPCAAPPPLPPLPAADVMFITLVHLCFCIFPLTLWLACVVGSRQLAARAVRPPSRPASGGALTAGGGGSGGAGPAPESRAAPAGKAAARPRLLALFTLPQWLALAAIVGVYGVGTWDKVAKLNGLVAVLVSPGLAWTIPLAVLLAAWTALPGPGCASCMGKRE